MAMPIPPKLSRTPSGEQSTLSPNISTQCLTPENETLRNNLRKESLKDFFLKKLSPILSKG